MYSRYTGNPLDAVPSIQEFRRREREPEPALAPPPPPPQIPAARGGFLRGGGLGKSFSGLLKNFRIDWDSGDILLILILLFLSMEGDDDELLIIMALALIMGF